MTTPLHDLGIFLLAGRVKDPKAALEEAVDAERLGLSAAWLSERYDLKEAGAVLGSVAARTDRLQIGSAVVAVGSRHPLLTAALACTMRGIHGDRFVLGLGRSGTEYLRGQSIKAAGLDAFADYVDIVRRLMNGETVHYDGPAGRYDSLRLADLPTAGPAPIWSVIVGGPKASRLAARTADGIMLAPFLTPEAVARSVTWIREERERLDLNPAIRICAPVISACDLDDSETLAITKARLVTYVQMRTFAQAYVRLNGWSEQPMTDIRNHPQFNRLDRANADQAFHRQDLLEPAQLIPDSWLNATATGTPDQCVRKLLQYRDAGADEIALYGSTPAQNTTLIHAWRQHAGQTVNTP